MKKRSRIAIMLAVSLIISILPVNSATAFAAGAEPPSDFYAHEGYRGVYLFWSNIEKEADKGLNHYELYVKAPGKTDYEFLAKVDDSDQEEYWQITEQDKSEFRYIHRPTVAGTYYYKLNATYADGSASQWVYSDITYAALEMAEVKASPLSGTAIKVSWNKIENADGYYVNKYLKSTRQPLSVITITSGGTTSWVDNDVKTGVEYEYAVTPYIYVDGKPVKTLESDLAVGMTGVSKVRITSLTTSAGTVTVKWSKNSKAGGYEIYRAVSASGKYTKVKVITGKTITTFTDKKKTVGKKYYYKVRAYATINGKKYYSDFSNSKGITISSKTLSQQQARKAYLILKNKSVYFPKTLIVNTIYSGTIKGERVIMIYYSAENAYGVRSRAYFTYWPFSGDWNHDYYLLSLKNKKIINKNKIINW